MKRLRLSLRGIGIALVVASFCVGIAGAWSWMRSLDNWRTHQDRAYLAGMVVFSALQNGTAPPDGVTITPLLQADQLLAQSGQFRRLSGAPQAARITNVPISADATNTVTGMQITLMIMSPDLQYKLADLPRREGQTAAETTGSIFRLLASFCSDPEIFAHMGDRAWVQISGADVWGCSVAPFDRRMATALGIAIALGILLTIALNTSGDFTQFADQLRSRRRLGGPTSYDTSGPQELQDIVSAVNGYLEAEREQLAKRAIVLSGVSHDLGTPATRLRLRMALIKDLDLREKLEADIDSMTGMIESVLTYTRAEMSSETPRKLSLNSLIDAIVADYQDTGSSVIFRSAKGQVLQGGRSVFMSGQGQSVVLSERPIIVVARPISLERAVCNLIDNALKYGRRATVGLEMDSGTATITIDDEGSETSAADIEALMAPFQRGDNTASIDGYGLGLTIAATIASLHGGSLSFEDTIGGLRARLVIQRS